MPDTRLHESRDRVGKDDVDCLGLVITTWNPTHQLDLVEHRVELRFAQPPNLRLDERDIGQYACERILVEPLHLFATQRILRIRLSADAVMIIGPHHEPPVDPDQSALIRPRLDLLTETDEDRVHIRRQERDHLKHVCARLVGGALRPRRHPVVLCELEERFQLGRDDVVNALFGECQGFGEGLHRRECDRATALGCAAC